MANTVLYWLGTRWTMILWPLPKETFKRRQLMMHESFHRIQEALGFPLSNPTCSHLDDPAGRLWLHLEWEALKKALKASEDSVTFHLESALLFRAQRHRLFSQADSLETLLEFGEGLAEYTGLALSGRTKAEIREYLQQRIQQTSAIPSFVRTLAYISVPVYGFFLDQTGWNWRARLSFHRTIDSLLYQAYELKRPKSISAILEERWFIYGGDRIQHQEKQRAAERRKRLAHYQQIFTQPSVIQIPLHKMNIQFDPRHVYPLATLGTVNAGTVRISDTWGRLNSSGAILIRPNWKEVWIFAAEKNPQPQGSLISGDTWILEIRPEWQLVRKTGSSRYQLIFRSR